MSFLTSTSKSRPSWRLFFSALTVSFLSLTSQAFSADIEWKLYVQRYKQSGPILTKTSREGEEFIIRENDCANIPADCQDIVGALDGASFKLDNTSTNETLSIHVFLNTNGNEFESVGGISLFLNLSFEMYVGGERADYLTFDRSPLEIAIPQTVLSTLLSYSHLTRGNLVCVYNTGGKFTDEGIETQEATSKMVVKLRKPAHTVGGSGDDLGIDAKVKFDTWSKIKLLFR